jgi:hypothetical protein
LYYGPLRFVFYIPYYICPLGLLIYKRRAADL